jgi:hypothetical protein
MRPQPFTLEEERYLISQLSQGDDRVATKALQWLCERYRRGYFLTDPVKVRSVTRLCLHRPLPNARRWAVNALAEIGTGSDLSPILELASNIHDDPDLLSSIVAAVFSGKPEEEASDLLNGVGIDISGLALIAAAQFSSEQKRALVQTLIPLETAGPAELRAAIVLAGTGKAPEHLFDRKFPNAITLSQLNLHDVSSVSKYSIWALAQLKLGFSSLQIPLSQLESSTSEVRKWVLRLLFSDSDSLSKNLDLLSVARKDQSSEVREEAAIELRSTFVDGMEQQVSDWFFKEENIEAKMFLLDHMSAQAHRSSLYGPIVMEFYRTAPPKSDRRIRIEAAAAGTELYRDLRKLDLQEESGTLFANDNDHGGQGSMVHINQNFSGSQIGAVSATGPVSVDTLNAIGQQTDAATKELLEKVVLALLAMKPEEQATGQRLVRDIAESPERSKWQNLLGFLKGAKEGAVAIGGSIEGLDSLIESVGGMI